MNVMYFKKCAGVSMISLLVSVMLLSSVNIGNVMGCGGSSPTIVTFNGPDSVNISDTVEFLVVAEDPNNLDVKYFFDWKIYPGQAFDEEEKTGWCDSSQPIFISHTFNVGGTYDIAVFVRNANDDESEIVVHDFNVDGGYTGIQYVEMWTEPDKFIPGQSVNFNSTIKNFGNRDYLETTHQPFVYFDGNRIESTVILHPRLLEVNETQNGGLVEDYPWPGNINEQHEIKFYYLEASGYLYKSAVENEPPLKPSIDGPYRATSEKLYLCSSSTSDPNEHKIYYLFDFGDGELSGWLGPYESGEPAEVWHSWYKGKYILKAQAKDEYGLKSEWSDPFYLGVTKYRTINIPRNLQRILQFFQQFKINNILIKIEKGLI